MRKTLVRTPHIESLEGQGSHPRLGQLPRRFLAAILLCPVGFTWFLRLRVILPRRVRSLEQSLCLLLLKCSRALLWHITVIQRLRRPAFRGCFTAARNDQSMSRLAISPCSELIMRALLSSIARFRPTSGVRIVAHLVHMTSIHCHVCD